MECGTVAERVPAPSVRKSNKGCIKIDNPQKKDHADPPPDAHGLCLANPCRVAFIGGVGASKTTTLRRLADLLRRHGVRVVTTAEVATDLLSSGARLTETRFQQAVLQRQLADADADSHLALLPIVRL
jgi:ABC-type sulfate/molybdate transport systems ATPase subunit